ncbi:hypothetical protein L208DRAFT_1232192, partial [Tricholoma matsutake]
VDWKAKTDYLCCSPNFYSQERYDCVIIHNMERDFFAHLAFIFMYSFEADAMFVSVRSICCGAFLVAENCKDGDYLVVDVVDTDMFLRIRSMYPPWESST